MLLPPVNVGSANAILTFVPLYVVVGALGMPGTVAATIERALENGPHPYKFLALTLTRYVDPDVIPVVIYACVSKLGLAAESPP